MSVKLLRNVYTKHTIPARIHTDELNLALTSGYVPLRKSSCPVNSVAQFSLNTVLAASHNLIMTDDEEDYTPTKTRNVMRSIAVSSFMFLSLNVPVEGPCKIVIVTRNSKSDMLPLLGMVKRFYPSSRIEIECFCGEDHDHTLFDTDPTPSRNILLSLGTTLEKHVKLVKKYQPIAAMFGINGSSQTSFQFYDGVLWIPPFGGRNTEILYLSSKTFSVDNPITSGSYWDSATIANSLRYFKNVTNETVSYINPFTGTPTYLFGKYLNDYSYLFVFHTLLIYFRRLGITPSEEKFQTAFSLLAETY